MFHTKRGVPPSMKFAKSLPLRGSFQTIQKNKMLLKKKRLEETRSLAQHKILVETNYRTPSSFLDCDQSENHQKKG